MSKEFDIDYWKTRTENAESTITKMDVEMDELRGQLRELEGKTIMERQLKIDAEAQVREIKDEMTELKILLSHAAPIAWQRWVEKKKTK